MTCVTRTSMRWEGRGRGGTKRRPTGRGAQHADDNHLEVNIGTWLKNSCSRQSIHGSATCIGLASLEMSDTFISTSNSCVDKSKHQLYQVQSSDNYCFIIIHLRSFSHSVSMLEYYCQSYITATLTLYSLY